MLFTLIVAVAACRTTPAPAADASGATSATPVRPGLSVLFSDSIRLLAGRRIGLITNQTGLDEAGRHAIDRFTDPAVVAAGGRLTVLFSPEHGIRGTEDRQHIANARDEKTGLPIISLYTNLTIPPPDSALAGIDVLVFDLQDVGTRTWTYVGAMLYAMQSAARRDLPMIVLDRPNPIGGMAVAGPVLDSALANPLPHTPARPGRAYAYHPLPLRHGLTMGELARYLAAELRLGVRLHVIPASGWRRSMWYEDTGLPWVRPSPNLPTVTSALVYPSLVALEATNVSVGRGTPDAFQRFGAPWLDAGAVVRLLEARRLPGVRFAVDSFTPRAPTDGKYAERRIAGVKIHVVSRDEVDVGRMGAAIVWALGRTGGDSLRVNAGSFDLRFGSPRAREALLRGEDPDAVMAREAPAVQAYLTRVAPHRLYPE